VRAMTKHNTRKAAFAAALALSAAPALAQEQKAQPLFTPFADLRYRLELVDQELLAEDATASTIRLRAGVRTAQWNGLSALVEAEGILHVGDTKFNDTINGRTTAPIVADPQSAQLNQFLIRFQPGLGIDAVAGRQTVNIDNQRWIGSVGWRQNDQTLDAARLTWKPVSALTLDYTYAWRVNRVFGPDSAQGIWGDSAIHLLRASVKAGPIGTASAYLHSIDLPAAPAMSSFTAGVRLAGEQAVTPKVKLLYALEYASQREHGSNPASFQHDYVLIEPGLSAGPVTARIGYERLEGNGTTALQTPLATLHAFNGWADKFLTTPANGLRDVYGDIIVRLPPVAGVKGSALRLQYHDFHSTRADIAYGSEWGAMLTLPVMKAVTLTAKVAHYDADRFATDTTKGWLSIDFKI
jgi:hypothetical protein